MMRGVLIGESLRLGASLRGVRLQVSAVSRFEAPAQPDGGPPWWTFIEFEVDEGDASELSSRLAGCLDPTLPWYASFKSEAEMFVVFAAREFRYPLGDPVARQGVEQYARSVGVPESQLDWES
jgi:hypothetical protein